MVSDLSAIIFVLCLALLAVFIFWSLHSPKPRSLLNHLYLWLVVVWSFWAFLMLCLWVTPPVQTNTLIFLDALTYAGIEIPPIYFMIALTFVKGYEHLPRWSYAFLVLPALAVVVALTNPYHHLLYHQFSLVRAEIVFGPFILLTGAHSYICFILSFALLLHFAFKNSSKLYFQQCIMLTLGGLLPMTVSMLATFSPWNLPITATPMAFSLTVLFNGIAIYKFNLLDITPVATQHVLDWISDCYLILSKNGLVVSYNKPFAAVFASRYGITENRYLDDCIQEDDMSKKTAIYNIITAVNACQEAQTTISYEQTATITRNGVTTQNYYVTDVSQLFMDNKPVGFVVIFKDITQLKKSMQQLQDSQTRMMEQERFAFLGQMMGGLAHNLKTPIMSISGCVSAVNNLVDECDSSLEDPKVTTQDFREIHGEIRDWLQKIRESTAYMSDIITAIKGQATNVSAFDESFFTMDELLKRTTLLMRHELVSGGCTLVADCKGPQTITLHGDINNLIQVLGNLVSNAIFAQKQVGGGCITVGIEQEGSSVKIYVKDTGPGIPEKVRRRLFKEMVTSKGAQGSGLGLYISNAVVHGKFNGTMWCEDNPGGGSIFGMTIPLASSEGDPSAPHPSGAPDQTPGFSLSKREVCSNETA